MPIHILTEQLASQIAAGEVVERPASVVKELVENALDAGASTIHIDIRQGGRRGIQVADDGQGISPAEVETAFLRHATSKLEKAEDLEMIATLGFRGEALAAIAAVSQVTIVTRTREEAGGVRLILEGGHVAGRDVVGAPQGTVISVENLFYNVPARLKFLKTVATEKRLIDEFVTNYALAYPDVRFRLTHDGRIHFQTSGSGSVRDVLVAIHGPEIARELLEISAAGQPPAEDDPGGEESIAWPPTTTFPPEGSSAVAVGGFVSPPSIHRANRNQIVLFVNGRWVKDKNLTYAIIQAYHTLLPVGRYPIAVLFVRMGLREVDVNVHPTKTEVRFRHSGRVFSAVQRGVRETIVTQAPVRGFRAGHFESLTRPAAWGGTSGQGFARGQSWDEWGLAGEEPVMRPEGQGALGLGWDGPAVDLEPADGPAGPAPGPALGGEKLPLMRVVGQIGASYIIAEGPDGMFLIDQHAAHERIQFEKMMAAYREKAIASQGLVAGTAVHLPPDQATLLEDHLPVLARLGFDIDPFGPGAFMIRAVPAIVGRQDPTRVMADIVADLERGDAPLQGAIEEKIIRRVCKTASIKAGQTLSRPEMEALVQQLELCQSPLTCPHGRPTLIFLSVAQLEREFGRA